MPIWNPECKVYVAGIEYTADTLASVRITYGRTDITQEVRAGVASFTILAPGAGLSVDINSAVSITLATSTGTETIFTGVVSDFTIMLDTVDFLAYQFTAVSSFARLGQTIVGGSGYSAELQGTRISNILRDGSGTLTWAQTQITWAAATYPWIEGQLETGTIADGWHFGAYTDGEVSALSAIQTAAQFGFLFEDPDGTINFADFYSRTGSSGYTVIDADETLRNSLRSELTSGQVVNSVTLTDYAGTEYTEENQNSITDYGRRYQSFQTYMDGGYSSGYEINVVLDNFVGDYSIPRAFVSGFTFPLSALDTATRDALIAVRGNTRWQVDGLPTAFGSNYKGIVEGWSWNITTGQALLSLYLSDWQLSQVFIPTP